MAEGRRDCAAEPKTTKAYERARRFVYEGEILPNLTETLRLAKELRDEQAYELARQVSALACARWKKHTETKEYAASDEEEKKAHKKKLRELLRVEVTCIYKDLELPAEESLPLALKTLADGGFDPEKTADPEMLGLAGAIHKRWWEYDGQRRHLEDSLLFYRRAYGGNVTVDDGYQAINAAFVIDLLASLGDAKSDAWRKRRKEADGIRQELIDKLPEVSKNKQEWWYKAVLIEAHFGLDHFEQAAESLRQAIQQKDVPSPWELESTLHQLAALARCRKDVGEDLLESPAWRALQGALDETWAAGLRSSLIGKVGLALSGGGFRASLYHIGVLARLAELDLLRHVEVLSCVSGGSIIGAYYYLEIRHLLQSRCDAQITRQHYICLVKRIEKAFLKGVQTNLRTRLLSDRETILRDFASTSFSQTERLGELFESDLYSKIRDGEQTGSRWLNRLFIEPKVIEPPESPARPKLPFNPRLNNWQRSAKVPILILNATTLNTGHSWQFTASDMGEAPGGRGGIETNPLLERFRYQDGPEAYRCFRLGHAVAASAAVPGLFDPVVAEDLFEGYRLRLADGGVFDNQGAAGLLSQGCTLLLVSDASGQLPADEDPGGGRLEVPLRANDILMARGREIQHRLLTGRLDASLLRRLVYIHLTQDLDAAPLEVKGMPGLAEELKTPRKPGLCTNYGIRRDIQAALARLRTDLDAFSDFEAWSLMESGYRTVSKQIEDCLKDVPMSKEPPAPWDFHAVVPLITTADRPREDVDALYRLLEVGESVFFKILRLRTGFLLCIRISGVVLLLLVPFIAVLLALVLSVSLAYLLIRAVLNKPSAAKPKSILQRIGALIAGLVTLPLAKAHLKWGNRRYLEDGKVPPGELPPGAQRFLRTTARASKPG
jgi:predicted acylesterase/phospholipase RssA